MRAADHRFAAIGATSGLLAVAFGAFGAHALRGRLAPDMSAVFETAARYQMYHALALLFTGWAAAQRPGRLASAAGWLFAAGTVLFSGSLYALALTGTSAFGAITPLGGLCLLGGWASLAAWAVRS